MAITAENLAKKYGVTRDESDEFALASQERALAAQGNGYLRRRDRSRSRFPARKARRFASKKTKVRVRPIDGEARQIAGAFR